VIFFLVATVNSSRNSDHYNILDRFFFSMRNGHVKSKRPAKQPNVSYNRARQKEKADSISARKSKSFSWHTLKVLCVTQCRARYTHNTVTSRSIQAVHLTLSITFGGRSNNAESLEFTPALILRHSPVNPSSVLGNPRSFVLPLCSGIKYKESSAQNTKIYKKKKKIQIRVDINRLKKKI